LFGSYVNGITTELSDIDIAVIYDEYAGDHWETASRLAYLTWDVSTDIEPHLLIRSEDPSGFVAEVLRTGQILYENDRA
jgi:predicted nucleotidyltransferase